MQLPGHDDLKTDIRPAVKGWFESPASGSWILVLDNADNIFDFYPETQVDVATETDDTGHGLAPFIPDGSKGTVIVTTRDHTVADTFSGGNILFKDVMTASETLQLFKDRYPNAVADEESVNSLLKELGYLPLAIVQTAAYLRQNRLLAPSRYLQQFKATSRQQRSLLSKPFRDRRREPGAETILATFAITFEQIRNQSPLAESFLEIMACIDRQGIPADLLRESVPEDIDINAADEALSKLIDFALITQDASTNSPSFVMHALVHVSAQEFISIRKTMQAAVEKTGKLLVKILPNGNHEKWTVGQSAPELCS